MSESNIKKVIPNIADLDGTKIEFWVEVNETLEPTRCLQDSTANGGRVALSDGTTGPNLSDVRDVTLHSL